MNTQHIYKKKDLLKLFKLIPEKLNDNDEYVVAFKTELHDIDLQKKDMIKKYLDVLTKMFDVLDDNCGIKFQFSVTPYEKDLFDLQNNFEASLRSSNDTKAE